MPSATDVLAYLGWWDEMLWRERHRQDPSIEWQRDMSWEEIAAIVGCNPLPSLSPGEPVMNADLAVELYWPGEPPGGRERWVTR